MAFPGVHDERLTTLLDPVLRSRRKHGKPNTQKLCRNFQDDAHDA
ncbi:MAG: hypothetical protein ABFD97_12980 [Syntrophobacter sp.]